MSTLTCQSTKVVATATVVEPMLVVHLGPATRREVLAEMLRSLDAAGHGEHYVSGAVFPGPDRAVYCATGQCLIGQ